VKGLIGKVLALIVLVSIIAGRATAQSNPVCTILLSSSSDITSYTSFQGMLVISLILMSAMAALAGICYGIGVSLKFDRLTRFAVSEAAEIMITAIIVIVFLGSFSLANGVSPGGPFAPGLSTFESTCSKLAGASFNLLPPLLEVTVSYDAVSLAKSLAISMEPNLFGFFIQPLGGLSLLTSIVEIFITFLGGLIVLLVGVAMALIIIYVVFPLFLFVGIVLRTLPVTRAAGGAFLGIFIGFYIFLPLLLNFMLLSIVSVPPNPIDPLTGFLPNAQTYLSSLADLFTPAAIISFLVALAAPAMYTLFAVAVSLLLTFDFAETVGDMLGAPSLSSKHTLRKII